MLFSNIIMWYYKHCTENFFSAFTEERDREKDLKIIY